MDNVMPIIKLYDAKRGYETLSTRWGITIWE